MIVYKTWRKVEFGQVVKTYRMVLLFGFIPIYIYING